MTNKHKDHWH